MRYLCVKMKKFSFTGYFYFKMTPGRLTNEKKVFIEK